MLKEKIKESENALSEKQCKWRNLLFDKSGKRYTGKMFFETQSEAAARLRHWENAPGDYNDLPEGRLWASQYAWGMQMPIMD